MKIHHDATEGPNVAEQSEEETEQLRDLLRVERRRARLLVDKETLLCAIQKGCLPCIYKLFPRGHPEIRAPNQRPETCPRAMLTFSTTLNTIGLYSIKQRILTVGDGDFSFSLCLATHLRRKDISDESKATIVASSYESQESVLKTYPTAHSTLSALSSAGVRVLHDIDARKVHEYSSINSKDYDVIVWNFPCKGVPAGFDGQVNEIEENKEMLQSFFKTCGKVLKPNGEVHVTHKTLEPFSWWKIGEIAESCGWIHECSVIFDKCVYPGYKNCKALDKRSFPTSDALIYIFRRSDPTILENSSACCSFELTGNVVAFEEDRVLKLLPKT